jgi:hypothetical protein
MKRLLFVAFAIATLLAAMTGPAWAVQPKPGIYTGGIPGAPAAGDGFFRVKSTPNGYAIVAISSAAPLITVPSDMMCNEDQQAYIPLKKLVVKANGSFSWKGTVAIGPGSPAPTDRTLTFKGSFDTRRKATGTTRIVGGGCNSGADAWTMKLES